MYELEARKQRQFALSSVLGCPPWACYFSPLGRWDVEGTGSCVQLSGCWDLTLCTESWEQPRIPVIPRVFSIQPSPWSIAFPSSNKMQTPKQLNLIWSFLNLRHMCHSNFPGGKWNPLLVFIVANVFLFSLLALPEYLSPLGLPGTREWKTWQLFPCNLLTYARYYRTYACGRKVKAQSSLVFTTGCRLH